MIASMRRTACASTTWRPAIGSTPSSARRADSSSSRNFATLRGDDPYWMSLRKRYAEGLANLVASIPPPPPPSLA